MNKNKNEEISERPKTPDPGERPRTTPRTRTNFPEGDPPSGSKTVQEFDTPDKHSREILRTRTNFPEGDPPSGVEVEFEFSIEFPVRKKFKTRTRIPENDPSSGSQTIQEFEDPKVWVEAAPPSESLEETRTIVEPTSKQTIDAKLHSRPHIIGGVTLLTLAVIGRVIKKLKKKAPSIILPYHLYGEKANCGTWLVATRNLPEIDKDVTQFSLARVVGVVNPVQNSILLEIYL